MFCGSVQQHASWVGSEDRGDACWSAQRCTFRGSIQQHISCIRGPEDDGNDYWSLQVYAPIAFVSSLIGVTVIGWAVRKSGRARCALPSDCCLSFTYILSDTFHACLQTSCCKGKCQHSNPAPVCHLSDSFVSTQPLPANCIMLYVRCLPRPVLGGLVALLWLSPTCLRAWATVRCTCQSLCQTARRHVPYRLSEC